MPQTQTRARAKRTASNGDLVIVPAECRRDVGCNASKDSFEARRKLVYAPTTLVMVFPPGEMAELRRLIWGDR